jgi:hypothetical protein
MEESGVIDAAVALLARGGLARDAMDRLVAHIQSLRKALAGLIDTATSDPGVTASPDTSDDLVEDIEKYTKVGIWLCQGQSATAERRPRPRTNFPWEVNEDDLDMDEYLWLNLTDAIVQVSQTVGMSLTFHDSHPTEHTQNTFDTTKIAASLRTNIQQVFTALLASTATPSVKADTINGQPKQASDHFTFLRILRAFLTRAARTAPSLSELRDVLADIFSAYTFEQSVLELAHGLIGSDVFTDMHAAHTLRDRGWRPRTQVCEHCKRRAWGPGIGAIVWDEWVLKEQERHAEKTRKRVEQGGGEQARRMSRGKGKASVPTTPALGPMHDGEETRGMTLVVFACRHVFHRVCLSRSGNDDDDDDDDGFREGRLMRRAVYRCPLCTAEQQ